MSDQRRDEPQRHTEDLQEVRDCQRQLAAEREITSRLRARIMANCPGGLTTTSPGEQW